MKVFVLGSCRVWKTAQEFKWLVHDFEHSVIQCHYADEILQRLMWLSDDTKKTLTPAEKKSFRTDMTCKRWLSLRQRFRESEMIFIEVSSIKKSLHDDDIFTNLLRGCPSAISSNKCIGENIKTIYKTVLNENKKCIFFPHVNVYCKKIMGYITNRTCLQDIFREVSRTIRITVVDPTEIVATFGQNRCMQHINGRLDVNHYTTYMIQKLGYYIQATF